MLLWFTVLRRPESEVLSIAFIEIESRELHDRMLDLADKSYHSNVFTYSPFLSLAEQEIYYESSKELSYASPRLFGGDDECERKIIRFGNPEEFGYDEFYPIKIVLISPSSEKFADELTHRDFLGAIVNLGINRSMIGDIRVQKSRGIVFSHKNVAEIICNELIRVKRTTVHAEIVDAESLESYGFVQRFEELHESVASKRADLIIAKVCKLSREKVKTLFENEMVAVNGRICKKPEYSLEIGDVFSVRGYGKFIYREDSFRSRKGNVGIVVDKYL